MKEKCLKFTREATMDITKTLKLLNIVSSTNEFSANGWSYEVAEKYLFDIDGKLLEAGFYTHYSNLEMNSIVKRVIELPTSYGCPMKCSYCASSCILDIQPLTTETLLLVTEYILSMKTLPNNKELLVTLTGTGDTYYTFNLIYEYISSISQKYKNLCFTISSCNWTNEILKKVESMSKIYKLRNIQYTFVSNNNEKLKRIIPGLNHINYNISDFVSYVETSSLRNWRINYLIIQSVNDDDNNFNDFIKIMQPIKNKIIVRISSLNETIASSNAGLKPASLKRSEVFQQTLALNGIYSYLFFSEQKDNISCGQLILEKKLTELH